MKTVFCLLLVISAGVSIAQKGKIVQFAVWKTKEGQLKNFEDGYKAHLNWHKNNSDKWKWYGWFVVSGPRTGYFMDGTFDHYWKDFDNPVNPIGDKMDNRDHVYPYADLQSVFKASFIPEVSIRNEKSLAVKYLQFISVIVTRQGGTADLFSKLKKRAISCGIRSLLGFKVVDGDDLRQMILMACIQTHCLPI